MAKPKKVSAMAEATGDLLSNAPVAPLPSSPPAVKEEGAPVLPEIVEYTPIASGRERWRVEKFQLLIAEVLSDGHQGARKLTDWELLMAQFHEMAQRYGRMWLIARRLFGIGPMVLPDGANPKDYEPRSHAEIGAELGINHKQLQAELDALRAIWRQQQPVTAPIVPEASASSDALPQLAFGESILHEFGFDEGMFELQIYNLGKKEPELRKAQLNRDERDWFCKRLQEWKKILSDTSGGSLAREALMNELYLRRFASEMAAMSPSTSKWKDLYESKRQIEKILSEQVSKLQEMFPEMTLETKSARAVLSDLINAYQAYISRGDRKLADKVFTAQEIEVMNRMSVQRPEPQYRFGLNMAIVEAMHGLFDPEWRTKFKPAMLKKLDAGYREAVVRLRESTNEPLVDLEKGVLPGEGDDFEDLKQAPPAPES